MKKLLTGRVASTIIALSSLLLLVVDDIIKPFLNGYAEVKLIIILVGVVAAYHSFLSFVLKSQFSSIIETLKTEIGDLRQHVDVLTNCTLPKDCIPYVSLEDIEKNHGLHSNNVHNEVWIIANDLQESYKKSGDAKAFLQLIYTNLKHNVCYYYILPDTPKSKNQVESLYSQLKSLYINDPLVKRKRKDSKFVKFNGELFIGYEANLEWKYPTEYFDIVIYIDCDANGLPIETSPNAKEGYYCFSKLKNDNAYLYSKMSIEKVTEIRDYYAAQQSLFKKIDLVS